MEINQRNIDLVKVQTISDKKQQLKRNIEEKKQFEIELENFDKKKKDIEHKFSLTKISEEQYETLKLEVNEMQSIYWEYESGGNRDHADRRKQSDF